MADAPDDPRAAGLAAHAAGRLAEAYRLLLPFAEAGDAEVQGVVGSDLVLGPHRYDSYDQITTGSGPAIDPDAAAADRATGVRFLEAASAAGVGPASFNLAGLYVMGHGDGPWAERSA